MTDPLMGLILGGFVDDELVGFGLVMAALEPHTAYGHMLGVLEEHRQTGLGQMLQHAVVKALQEKGITRMYWTYEPLESRNTHIYLNKAGAVVTAYKEACFEVDCEIGRASCRERV